MNAINQGISKRLVDRLLVKPAKRFAFASNSLLYATEKVFSHIGDPYEELKERFIEYSKRSRWDYDTLYGAGFGFADASPFLTLMIKGQSDVGHIHRLTLENRPLTRLGWVGLREQA